MYKWLFIGISIAFMFRKADAQNLIVNPGAEVTPLVGWTPTNPADTWGGATWVTPHGGSYHFFPYVSVEGLGVPAEIYQDIDVSSNATSIDAGTASYTFTGWMNGWTSGNDRSQIIVEFRNSSGTPLGTSYNTNLVRLTSWTQYTNTRTAPVGTRTIRIRLISVRNTASDNDGYFDDLSLILNAPMPVELLSFSALYSEPSVQLNWSTAAELNNASFTVERSADGLVWTTISTTPGAGNSTSLRTYTFIDPNPLQGISYYRLKQSDYDGAVHYSSPAAISIFSGDKIKLYPNPATDQLHVIFTSDETATFVFVNSPGQELTIPFIQEGTRFTFDLSSLSSGMYLLQIQSSSGIQTEKIIIK